MPSESEFFPEQYLTQYIGETNNNILFGGNPDILLTIKDKPTGGFPPIFIRTELNTNPNDDILLLKQDDKKKDKHHRTYKQKLNSVNITEILSTRNKDEIKPFLSINS